MSFSPDSHPGTPREKSSQSSLLATFKSLTGSKPKHASATTLAASAASDSDSATGRSATSQFDDLVLSRLSSNQDVTPPISSSPMSLSIDRPVDGPAKSPELESLLRRLHKNNGSSTQRITAARQMASFLRNGAGADVIEVWTTARDMLDFEDDDDARDAIYDLFLACVKQKTLSPGLKRFFFSSIPRTRSQPAFSQRFNILSEITEHARNLADIEIGIMPLLVSLLDNCYEFRKQKKDKDQTISAERDLLCMFGFIVDALKYNAKIFSDPDLELLIKHLLNIWHSTSVPTHIKKTLETINALITYSHLPKSYFRRCIEALCGTFCNVSGLKADVWKVAHNLLNSHLESNTLNALTSIMKDNALEPESNSTIIRGAVQILREMIKSSDVEYVTPVNLPKYISAARQSLECNSTRLPNDILQLILELVASDDAPALLFNDKTWTNVSEILPLCAETSSSRPSGNFTLDAVRDDPITQATRDGNSLASNAIGTLQEIANRLIILANEVDRDQAQSIMKVLMKVVRQLDDSSTHAIVEHHAHEFLLYPSNKDWASHFEILLKSVTQDQACTAYIRKHSIQALRDAYLTAEALNCANIEDMLLKIVGSVSIERNLSVLEELCQTAVVAAVSTPSEKIFDSLLTHLMSVLSSPINASRPVSRAKKGFTPSMRTLSRELAHHVAVSLVKILIRSIRQCAWKSLKVYDCLLSIARSNQTPAEARVVALKALFRLRADVNHLLFLVSSTECEDVAAMLCRTTDTLIDSTLYVESPSIRPTRLEDQVARRINSSAGAPQKSTTNRVSYAANRSSGSPGNAHRPHAPLWLYPGPRGLPEEPPFYASHLLTVRKPDVTEEAGDLKPRSMLDIAAWLELLIGILQQPELEWEVYSYILVHLGGQLANHALFVDAIAQVSLLRSVVCDQLANRSFHEPPVYTNLKTSDVATCVYHVLTMLISYHHHFSKSEQDDMVKMFVNGIGTWDEQTTEICIHALSICCHELPMSLTKSLELALAQMSRISTQTQVTVHILEFLAGLARLPELFKNFREEEFKMVFGICSRYLQFVRDSRASSSQNPSRPAEVKSIGSQRDFPTLPGRAGPLSTLHDELPQYVYALAFHVMSFWFMSLKLQDRHKHIDWITRQLLYKDNVGGDIMEEQAHVTIDMMYRVAFSDRDETESIPEFTGERAEPTIVKSWLIGMSILTVETACKSGLSQMTRRRPSGTTHSVFAPRVIRKPRHQVSSSTSMIASVGEDDSIDMLPDHIVQQLYAPQTVLLQMTSVETPQALPDDDGTKRALNVFDRISPLDGHRVGIIYVGEAQCDEVSILSNVMGSADYTSFLENIGFLTELKGAPFNTQGLDREYDSDGKFTYGWRDRVTELVFHVTTMMPTNLEHDERCNNKKKHIGNDYVNIIFNNSGESFKMETFPSELNYVNIVITPEARASFVETRIEAETKTAAAVAKSPSKDPNTVNPYASLFYKVTVLTKPGIPPISPAFSTKIISGASLPAFVRLLALNASVFSQVWANRKAEGGSGELVSSWRSRLKEIQRLRTKHCPPDPPAPQVSRTSGPPASSSSEARGPPGSAGTTAFSGGRDSAIRTSYGFPSGLTHASGSSTRQSREPESVVFRRASHANIFSGNASSSDVTRISGFSSSTGNDAVERTSSAGSGN